MSTALVFNIFWQKKIPFLMSSLPNLKIFLTLRLSQYCKSGSTSSSKRLGCGQQRLLTTRKHPKFVLAFVALLTIEIEASKANIACPYAPE